MMPLLYLRRSLRELSRYSQVLAVLVRYGFGDLVQQVRLDRLRLFRRLTRARGEVANLSREKRIRLAFQALGPTFIKLGQILSTRPDLLSADLEEELAHLQDDVPPVPYAAVERVLAEEFAASGSPLGPFREFEREPIAAASVAQVHRAVLEDGTEVAVKIRRPGIRRMIEVDLVVLRRLAGLLARFLSDAELYDPLGVVDQLGRTIHRELDFAREGRQCEQFGKILRADPHVRVPRVHWAATTRRVLTLDFVRGIKISELVNHPVGSFDLPEIARRGADVVLKTVFRHGVFHGDPHPGNILVSKDGVLNLLDFGIVGYLEDDMRERILDLMIAVVRNDVALAAAAITALGNVSPDTDLRALRFDLRDFLETYRALPLRLLRVGEVIRDMVRMITRHRIRIPAELAVLAKVLVELDGLGRRLHPDFNMVEHVKPFIKERVKERYDPRRLATQVIEAGMDTARLLRTLPSDVSRILESVREGRLELSVIHRETDPVTGALREMLGRLACGIFAAGVVVAGAVLVSSDVQPLAWGLSVPGLLGLAAGLLLGLRCLLGARARGG
ncbi:MAG: AarF/UbiB family protein [Planctomycetota bacterium]